MPPTASRKISLNSRLVVLRMGSTSGFYVVIGLATALSHVVGVGAIWGGALITQGILSLQTEKPTDGQISST